jgi:hypothetical protein
MADRKDEFDMSARRLVGLSPRDPSNAVSEMRDVRDVREEFVGRTPPKYVWRSCCMECDSRAVVFFSQFCVSVGVISFCIYQMAIHDDCESQKGYGSLLTFLVGLLLPSPKISSNN